MAILSRGRWVNIHHAFIWLPYLSVNFRDHIPKYLIYMQPLSWHIGSYQQWCLYYDENIYHHRTCCCLATWHLSLLWTGITWHVLWISTISLKCRPSFKWHPQNEFHSINSLSHGGFGWHFKHVIFNFVLLIDSFWSYDNVLRSMQ